MHSLLIAGNDATALLPTATASLAGAIAAIAACSVTLNRFVVVNDLSPLDRPQQSGLVPRWRCADDCRAWQRVHSYRESQRSILNGLNPVGRENCVREFEVLCE